MTVFLRQRPRRFKAAMLALTVGIFAAALGSQALADTAPPKPMTTPAPEYPPKALSDGVSGYVEVEFTVMPDGSVQDVSVVGADPPRTFEVAAVKAVSQWKFKPGTRDGAPVAVHVRQKLSFNPDN